MLCSFESQIFLHSKLQQLQKYFVYFKAGGRCYGGKDAFKTVSIPMEGRLSGVLFFGRSQRAVRDREWTIDIVGTGVPDGPKTAPYGVIPTERQRVEESWQYGECEDPSTRWRSLRMTWGAGEADRPEAGPYKGGLWGRKSKRS